MAKDVGMLQFVDALASATCLVSRVTRRNALAVAASSRGNSNPCQDHRLEILMLRLKGDNGASTTALETA